MINFKISPSERWTLILKLGVGKVMNTGTSYCTDISKKIAIRATDTRPKVSVQFKMKCKAKVNYGTGYKITLKIMPHVRI